MKSWGFYEWRKFQMGVKLDSTIHAFKNPTNRLDGYRFLRKCCKIYLKSSSQNDAIIFFIHDFTSSTKKTTGKESNWMWNFAIKYKEGREREITSNFTALAQRSSSSRGSPRVQGRDKTQWGSDEPSKSGSVGISKLKLLVNHSSSHNLLVVFSK